MDTSGLGAGLVALAFWGFIASTVVGGIWYAIREKEMKQETLRRIIESGRDLDEDIVSMIVNDDSTKNVDRDLKVGGLITLAVAPGLIILGIFLRQVEEKAFFALLGVSGLVACVGLGLLVAARYVARRNELEAG